MKFKELNEAQQKEFFQSVNRTWDSIAMDVLALYPRNRCKQAEALEAIFDADHITTYGEINDPEVKRFVKDAPYKELLAAGRKALPDKYYAL